MYVKLNLNLMSDTNSLRQITTGYIFSKGKSQLYIHLKIVS